MPVTMTDPELKQLIALTARAAGLELTQARIDRDLVAYKGHLSATARIRTVPLPLEAEPFVVLKP